MCNKGGENVNITNILLFWGIPTTIFGAIVGLLVWWLKRYIDKNEKKRDQQDADFKRLMLMIMQTGHANNVLAVATATAVQRIPDAHCNGDMTDALKRASEIQNEEKDFLMDKGIEHIFEHTMHG